MAKRTIAIVAGAALLGGAALSGAASYADVRAPQGDSADAAATLAGDQAVPRAELRTNAKGETFGRGDLGWLPSQQPDLVQAIGIGGIPGYVKQTDLHADMPKTLEERVRLAEHPTQTSRTIPLYESDGVTVVGQFAVGSGTSGLGH